MEQYLPHIITIMLALFGGFITLNQIKSATKSRARIEKITLLRNHVSEFLSELELLVFELKQVIKIRDKGENEKAEEQYYRIVRDMKPFLTLNNKIILFLDPIENEYILDNLKKLAEEYPEYNNLNKWEEYKKIEKELISQFQEYFKLNWLKATKFQFQIDLKGKCNE